MKHTYTIDEAKNRTWGYTARLWKDGRKLCVASGCGYCKHTACVEAAVKDATGKYVSLGGYEYPEAVNNTLRKNGINAIYSIQRGRVEQTIIIETPEEAKEKPARLSPFVRTENNLN